VVSISVLLVAYFIINNQLGSTRVEATPAAAADSISREIPNDAFGPGEYLKYNIGYGFVTAGTAFLAVEDTNTLNGKLCYRIKSQTNSNSFFDSFYKVRDTVLCQIDVDGIFSRFFFKSLHEGSYNSTREITMHIESKQALTKKDSDAPDTLTIHPFTQDELSIMYYIRTIPLEVDKSVMVPCVSGDKSTIVEVKILKRETVEVPAGVFKCIVVEPLFTAAGVFRQEGEIKVWLTDDRLRMPVLMKSKVLVGSIYAELSEFKLGKLDW
jgi:hypothetical protein